MRIANGSFIINETKSYTMIIIRTIDSSIIALIAIPKSTIRTWQSIKEELMSNENKVVEYKELWLPSFTYTYKASKEVNEKLTGNKILSKIIEEGTIQVHSMNGCEGQLIPDNKNEALIIEREFIFGKSIDKVRDDT